MSSVEFHKFRENIKNINDYTDQKEKIFDNFIDQGLPNKRNESWKYFDLVSKSKKYIKSDNYKTMLNLLTKTLGNLKN